MDNFLKSAIVAIVVFVTPQYIFAQQPETQKPLSFEQALWISLNNNHTIKQAEFFGKEKSALKKSAKGLYLPTVGINAAYITMNKDITLDLTPVKDAITPLYEALSKYGNFSGVANYSADISTQAVRSQLSDGLATIEDANWNQMIQKKTFGTIDASFAWPIYAGGKVRAANHVASLEVDGATQQIRQKQGEILSELVERYYGLSLANEAVTIRQQVFDGMSQHLHDAKKMYEQGFIAKADVLHAQLFYDQSLRDLDKSKNIAKTSNVALNNTLTAASDSTILPISQLFYLDSIQPLSYFQDCAKANNPMLKQIATKKLMADENEKVKKGDFLPQVALMGTYDLANKDLSPYMPEWLVGVAVKWSLFEGTSRISKYKASTYTSDQVDEFQMKAETDIQTMIEKLYNELNMYIDQLKALESSQAFAEEYVRVREKSFHEEMSNETDVVDANLVLAQVKIEKYQAMYGYDVTLSKLLQYAGIPENFLNYSKTGDCLYSQNHISGIDYGTLNLPEKEINKNQN